MSKDTNRLLGHADEADGIDEYDNPLPDWWLGLFWLTILWGIGYGVHYHFIAERSQAREIAAEMAAAEVRWPALTQSAADVEFSMSPDAIAAGRQTYETLCFTCHGTDLEGGIGVPLNDDEWIHGNTPEDLMRTITEGVLAKGMPAWGPVIGAEGVSQVAAYVLSRNGNGAGNE